jgi:hypothetical protein
VPVATKVRRGGFGSGSKVSDNFTVEAAIAALTGGGLGDIGRFTNTWIASHHRFLIKRLILSTVRHESHGNDMGYRHRQKQGSTPQTGL